MSKRLANTLGIILALLWIFPVYWMVNTAFLPASQSRSTTPTFVPFGGDFSAFSRVLTPSFMNSLFLSLRVTLLVVVVALIFAFLAALAVSRFRFAGRKGFILTILIVQMIPAEALFISQYKMLQGWGLLNSVAGLSLLYVAAVLPFTVWMLRGFVDGIPADLEQAAMIDGCSRTSAFFRITFPLLAPGLVASGVYAFLQAWNEFTLATVIMNPSTKTLPLWLRGLAIQSNQATDWPGVMAGSVLVALPVIIFFMLVQGRMTSGLVSGAVKG
ncbi:carbohydrate ABC transporter permease [Jonesia quinghaiensis]|uniref:carbohydrate ABC transporter permease n=1 Tax=Jonesia quinghaiensis TaxID=262806 RepID=UPI000419025E|nr:carbohydrate ABC transporter permease [Jonesia quinghaiensis]